MKSMKLDMVRDPMDPTSPITKRHYYTVVLGNHHVVQFTSDRHASAFAAEACRMMNEQMMRLNLLLIEAFELWRLSWPLLAHDRTKSPHAKLLDSIEKDAAGAIAEAQRLMDLCINRTASSDGPFRAWKWIAAAASQVRHMALSIAELHRHRTDGIQRFRAELLVERCNEVATTLKHYGLDAPNAVGVVRSPYETV